MRVAFSLALAGMFGVLGLAAGVDARVADAAQRQDIAAVRALIAQKAGVNAPQIDGTTALMWAVRADNVELVDLLLRAGADVKASNRYGLTPLYLAALNGNAAIIERLLKAGADANATGPEGETALMTVAHTGHVDAAKVLLDHGAKVDAREEWRGQTALIWAVAQSHPEMVKLLIEHGADVNLRTMRQEWKRQVTAEPREKWLPQGYLTPLLFASRQGCLECARLLVEHGADMNATDLEGVSPLISAIINGHYDVAGYLIDRGADVNIADKTGRTALYAAVDFHTMPMSNRPSPKEIDNDLTSMDIIQKLLAHGANVNAQLITMQPYRSKIDRGDDTIFGAGTTPILRAAKAGDVEVVKLLLAKGADPKLSTRAGINPLMAAAGVGTREEDTTGRRKTEADAIETIKVLMAAGLDVNAADGAGRTALHGSAMWAMDKVVAFLVENGARLDAKDKRGFTPLDYALGKAGGLGFDAMSSQPHPTTAALLEKLASAQAPSAGERKQ
jgi:ankyrin repeat protein